MSKRASLTLRKPGQRPDPKAIEAFIAASDDEDNGQTSVTPIKPVPAPEPMVSASAPPVTKGKASPAKEAAVPDVWMAEPAEDVPTFRRATRSIAKRKTKPDRRRTTVYMELILARQLAAHCAENDLDMSDAVNAALRSYLT